MTSQSTVRKLLGGGLAALGIFLECGSCYPEILRDGNEPIASGLGLLGLFCIGAGWIAYRSASEPMPERRRVRQCLLFEHVAYCAGLLMVWLLVERQPFFVDTPFGRDILALHTTLMLVLGAVIGLSAAQFVGGVVQRVDLSHILVDVLIGLLLMVHFAVCTERTQRSGGVARVSNG